MPIADVRRTLIDLMHFLTRKAPHPLSSWWIQRLREQGWTQKRIVE
ncbi:hypothetical protein ACWGH7_31395 [Streptomyces cyaneofuscatus]